ncbi:MAG TPA: tripartite tricarboxylate transporter substrate binding protein [Acidobacteriaceae bacterium]|nr:tripartite tricarboxylate transporter substrate binding protein [Acidobacteriaceae bacterium]
MSLVALTFTCTATGATAADAPYPSRPIHFVLPVPPGGGTDTIARIVGQKLGEELGQSVIIDNRPGAGGNIAEELVAHAPPDGYTLVVVTASHATNGSLYSKLGYDPLKDLVPVTQFTSQPYLFVVNPAVPAKNVQEFVAYAKKKDGRISYASSGSGLLGHLGMEQFKLLAGFKAVHIPYKGAGPALVDTIAGRTEAFFPTIVSGLPQVKAGKVRALAITGSKRSDLVPDVPTFAESGYPGFEVLGWYGLLAPAGTPPAVIKKLYEATAKVLAMPDVRKQIAADGAEPVGNTPEQFDAYIKSEAAKWAKVVAASGAKID